MQPKAANPRVPGGVGTDQRERAGQGLFERPKALEDITSVEATPVRVDASSAQTVAARLGAASVEWASTTELPGPVRHWTDFCRGSAVLRPAGVTLTPLLAMKPSASIPRTCPKGEFAQIGDLTGKAFHSPATSPGS